MNHRAEQLMKEVRDRLEIARQEERSNPELALVQEAIAANKIVSVLRITDPHPTPYAFAIDRDDSEERIRAAAVCK